MEKNFGRLEDLPNEIFMEIFKNFDARDLFRAFYNLTSRFNSLLQSLDHCLTVSTPDSNKSVDDEIFFPYVHTVIIQNGIDINFDHLTNVCRVILHDNSKYPARDLQVNLASTLQYFSAFSTHTWLLTFSAEFIEKIFSNGFPALKSCCLPGKAVILLNGKWTQSPSLRIFKIGFIRSNIYKLILSSCPNLHSLKFRKWPMEKSALHIEPHMNLKRMVISFSIKDCLNHHLSSVPKLEELTIRVIIRDSDSVKTLEECDWFASSIERYLPMLRRFHCYVVFTPSAGIHETDQENLQNQLEEKFVRIHHGRYQLKIGFKFP